MTKFNIAITLLEVQPHVVIFMFFKRYEVRGNVFEKYLIFIKNNVETKIQSKKYIQRVIL